jgi:hypothetical protein
LVPAVPGSGFPAAARSRLPKVPETRFAAALPRIVGRSGKQTRSVPAAF